MKAFTRYLILSVFFLIVLGNNAFAQAGGDIYVLQDINFSEVYKEQPISVNVAVENKQFNGNTADAELTIIIRDSQGTIVYTVTKDDDPESTLTFTADETIVKTILLDNGSGFANIGNAGETYALFAQVLPYFDEDVNANNHGLKTFTVVDPPNPISVPDAPLWAPLLLVSIIIGWLFIGNKEYEE